MTSSNALKGIAKELARILKSGELSERDIASAHNLISDSITILNSKEKTPLSNPMAELLGEGHYEPFKKAYIRGLAKNLSPFTNGPADNLKNKLDSIFSGLDEYLKKIATQKLKEIKSTSNIKKEANEFSKKYWHSLANSIATHARILHRKSQEGPSLLYISLDKYNRKAKVIVLDDPSRGDIYSELHPDTKAINEWIKKLEL